jgi:hypothetical protein
MDPGSRLEKKSGCGSFSESLETVIGAKNS